MVVINGKQAITPQFDYRKDTVISYTQFSMYASCPKSWELAYAKNLRSREPNIHLFFGIVMHESIQMWMDGIFKGDGEFDPVGYYQHIFQPTYENLASKWGKSFSTIEEISDIYDDGIAILEYLQSNLAKYFNPRKYEYIESEVPLYIFPDPDNPNLKFFAYLDMVFKDKHSNRYYIVDIKTSTKGWSKYQFDDKIKTSQLLLYKYYFADYFDINIEQIDAEFFIVKRKVEKDTKWQFGSDRVQLYRPPQSKRICTTYVELFDDFVDNAFDENGKPDLGREYPAIAGEKYSNCRFCEFADDEQLCPKNQRIVE